MFANNKTLLFLSLLSKIGTYALGMDKTYLERMPTNDIIHSNPREHNGTEVQISLRNITSTPVVSEMHVANTFTAAHHIQQSNELAEPSVNEFQTSRKRPTSSSELGQDCFEQFTLPQHHQSTCTQYLQDNYSYLYAQHQDQQTQTCTRLSAAPRIQSQRCTQLSEPAQSQVSQSSATKTSITAEIGEYGDYDMINVIKDGAVVAKIVSPMTRNKCQTKFFTFGNRYCVCLFFKGAENTCSSPKVSVENLYAVYVCDTTSLDRNCVFAQRNKISIIDERIIQGKSGIEVKNSVLMSIQDLYTLVVNLDSIDNSFIVTKNGLPYMIEGAITNLTFKKHGIRIITNNDNKTEDIVITEYIDLSGHKTEHAGEVYSRDLSPLKQQLENKLFQRQSSAQLPVPNIECHTTTAATTTQYEALLEEYYSLF